MCIFCMIANKEIPSNVLYEDDKFISFLDLSQATKGHALVIPKKHFSNVLECDNEYSKEMLNVCQKVSTALIKTFDAKGINILTNCGEAAGQTVMHFHIHLIPRYDNDDLKIEFTDHSKDYDLTELRDAIVKNV